MRDQSRLAAVRAASSRSHSKRSVSSATRGFPPLLPFVRHRRIVSPASRGLPLFCPFLALPRLAALPHLVPAMVPAPGTECADWFWHTQIEHLRVLDAGPDRRARDYGTLRRDLLLHDAI